MDFNNLEIVIATAKSEENNPENTNIVNISNMTNAFLGQDASLINIETIQEIENSLTIFSQKCEKELGEEKPNKKTVNYNKRNKCFFLGGDESKKFTIGQIISARRQGVDFCLPESLKQSGDGKKLIRIMTEKLTEDKLYGRLNKELASSLAEKTKKTDMLMSKAYSEIAYRSDKESKQFGIVAEKIILGTLEKISIDRPDLGITVREANAKDDVKNKIDFIILAKHKVRGVGINRQTFQLEEKSIGIQFTTNINKHEHKIEQISKAKERGIEVDDIIYVELNHTILNEAIHKWEKQGKNIDGPFGFLPTDIQKQVITSLLKGVVTPEQEIDLIKMAR